MPIRATNSLLLIDNVDFTPQTTSWSVTAQAQGLDCTNLASTAMTYTPGLPGGKIEHKGFYTGVGAGYLMYELRTRIASGDNGVVTVLADTTATPTPAYTLTGSYGESLKVDAPAPNQLITVDGSWMTNALRCGKRIYSGTVSSTGNMTVFDFGSAGSAGGVFVLHVTGIVGSATNATISVQSATTSGGSYTTRATITLSATGGYTATIAGTIDRYVRLSVGGLGGATSITMQAILAVTNVTG